MGGLCDYNGMGALLPFSAVKLIGLVLWFYLCMYSVQRSDRSPLIADRYRYLSNIAAIFFGPLVLIWLFIVETVRDIHEGRLERHNLPQHILDAIVNKPVRKAGGVSESPPIELMDTSGRRFKDVYEQVGSGDHQIQVAHFNLKRCASD